MIQGVEEEVTLHDIFAQITSVKKDISESFSTLSIRIDQLRFELTNKTKLVNPPMVKPFRLTYLVRRVATSPLEILTIACLTFCLLLTVRPTLGLPEYKLKAVNICKMHRTGGLEVEVLCAF